VGGSLTTLASGPSLPSRAARRNEWIRASAPGRAGCPPSLARLTDPPGAATALNSARSTVNLMRTEVQVKNYRAFMASVSQETVKIQIGARGKKRGNDWIAADLYDQDSIIDAHWDLHCLPLADNSVDCYVCNAVLEHVLDPQLAVSELLRTLRFGGQIWTEVPFLQYYHPTPGDYYRWTAEGFRLLLKDFEEIASGVSVMIGHEINKICNDLQKTSGIPISEATRTAIGDYISKYQSSSNKARLYSSVFFWGIKNSEPKDPKKHYFDWLRSEYADANVLPYRKDIRLSRADLIAGRFCDAAVG
jgi:SAM-dependent methyltransferase